MSRRRFKTSLLLRVIIYLGYFNLLSVSVYCEKLESDVDDELISQLLEVPIVETVEESDVSKILKILEAGEEAATTTTPIPQPESTTTTEKSSPFFQTERPGSSHSYYSPRQLQETDEQLNSIISSLMELEGLNLNMTNSSSSSLSLLSNATLSAMRRSDPSHFPPVENLLWSTAQAVWDVSKPVFYRTKTGRKVSLIQDTVTLPLRTYGHIKHKILDLTSGHYPHGRKRSILHHHHGHHHHDHGWGWDSPVYVKYEPHNSLFKSWLRYLYWSIRPAIISKIRLKRMIIRAKLRFLRRLIRILKSAKWKKAYFALQAVIKAIRDRLSPKVVVLKEAEHVHHHGWGWHSHPAPAYHPPPAPAPTESGWMKGPPPTEGYAWAASNPPQVSYGPPAHGSYGQQKSASPVAYGQDNTYNNYDSAPSSDLMAPEQWAQSSENFPQKHEAPSYAKYLKEIGINPSTLSSPHPEFLDPVGAQPESIRSFRDAKGKQEEVPYLTKEEEAKAAEAKMGHNL